MILIVQEIVTNWTKASRTGQGARRRNAVPASLPLPHTPAAPGRLTSLVHHQVAYPEAREFQADRSRFETRPLNRGETLRVGCALVRHVDGGAEVVWAWHRRCGAPPRSEHPRTVLTLAAGEWGRVRWSGRRSSLFGMQGWSYQQTTVNVAVHAGVPLDPFPGQPTQEFSALADLR